MRTHTTSPIVESRIVGPLRGTQPSLSGRFDHSSQARLRSLPSRLLRAMSIMLASLILSACMNACGQRGPLSLPPKAFAYHVDFA
ncbi:MAG: hypothetical protein EB114_13725 [Betaproteobacteria bacterium]|nr:hypothetical protein [Betaproteobacteria bacterium]NCW34169.1 hypothetical protein [Betaproteobacteria bacterium]NCX62453.1 hypothetical protein [Betaproteobacteria bacterium]NCZ82571.1 hypothetical protein [Betaproteobacteria bacterium]NDA21820.1 hypothetical protein [Betaproteobacteria bacterium]